MLKSSLNTKLLVVHVLLIAGCVAVIVSLSWRWALPLLWSSSLRAVCSAVWRKHLLASRCRWAFSRFCASWLVSSARRIRSRRFSLHGKVEAVFPILSVVSQASLARLCSRLFWRRSWRLSSWDSAVSLLTSFIGIDTFCFKEITRTKENLFAKSSEKFWNQNDVAGQRTAHAHARCWWSVHHTQAREIEMASRLVLATGRWH